MDTPLVSVLMTCYNRENYIAAAIESVLASIYNNIELIICDDCSKDNTVVIANKYNASDKRVKVFVNPVNLGDYKNRNKAASFASGKYIKYLDSDDVMYAHCLQVMVAAMEKFPEAGFGLSAKGDPAKPYPVCISPREIYLEHFNGFGHFQRAPGSAIIRKDVFDSVGGFSGRRYIGDAELWLTLAQKNYMVKLPVDLYWSRQHNNSESIFEKKDNIAKVRKELFELFIDSPDCPLHKNELKNSIIRKIKRKVKGML